jgi:hypothetical protein
MPVTGARAQGEGVKQDTPVPNRTRKIKPKGDTCVQSIRSYVRAVRSPDSRWPYRSA